MKKRYLLLGVVGFIAVCWLERRQPLRRPVEPKWRRELRNVTVAAAAAATIQLLEQPLVQPLARMVEGRRWGLLGRLQLSPKTETVVGLLLLDYTLYVWHYLAHRVPLLWRFHAVHHLDLDCDASTALRFHFGEMVLSIPWRLAQVAAIGVRPSLLQKWQAFVLVCIVFHHSNLRLPVWLERPLSTLVVTPRLHGIHHCDQEAVASSNWSSGLTIWDWLHGTLRLTPAQEQIVVGVPALRGPNDVELPQLWEVPFRRPPADYWDSTASIAERNPGPSDGSTAIKSS